MRFLKILVLLILTTCSDESLEQIPDGVWLYTKPFIFDFQIHDTTKNNTVIYKIAYTNDYPYQNHYIKYYLVNQEDTFLEGLKEIPLFALTTGKPLGKQQSHSTYLYETVLLENKALSKPNAYRLICHQYMRSDSLFGVQGLACRLEQKDMLGETNLH